MLRATEILGAAIVSTNGGEVVQIFIPTAAGVPYTVLKGAAYIHPTLPEGFWTLMEQVKLTA
jgi:pyruvate/2-oxoglutarate dehydrogenase complex dihydrolipoamide dehydrogenase (E3) component